MFANSAEATSVC